MTTSKSLADPLPEPIAPDYAAALNPRRWAMFAVLLIGAFIPPLNFYIVNVALPSIRGGLGASASAEQLIVSVYAGLYAVTLITGGRLGDMFGRCRIFLIGLAGFATASLLCGFTWSPWSLIAGRALQGVTAALMAPQALASIHAIFPARERHLALSLFGAVFGLAAVIGQALGGVLISLNLFGLGWRTIFLVNVPAAILVALFGIPFLKETREPDARKLDFGGMAMSMLALCALIVPLVEGREAGWPLWSVLCLCAVPALVILLWRYEIRLAQSGGAPLLDATALRAHGLGRALMIALLFNSIGAFFLLFSVYLQEALHATALSAGFVFLPFGIGFLLGPLATPVFARIVGDRVNPASLGLQTLGFIGLAWIIQSTATGIYPAQVPLAAILFLIGFGQGLGLPSLMHLVTSRVAPELSGMIAGVVTSTLQVGTALSVALIGGIYYTVLGGRADVASISHAFVVASLCIAACLGAGACIGSSLVHRGPTGQ